MNQKDERKKDETWHKKFLSRKEDAWRKQENVWSKVVIQLTFQFRKIKSKSKLTLFGLRKDYDDDIRNMMLCDLTTYSAKIYCTYTAKIFIRSFKGQ